MRGFTIAMLACAAAIVPAGLNAAATQSWTSVQRDNQPMVTGSGRIVRQNRAVEDFRRVDARGAADVQVRLGARPSVVVEADDNLIRHFTTEVSDGTLVLDTRGSFRTRSPARIYVTVPNIERAVISGSGNLTVEDVANRRLELVTRGSGNLRARGRTGELELVVQGSGNADMRALQSARARVSVMGSGNAWVSTSGAVDARSFGSGNVFVDGSPSSVEVSRAGSGQVVVNGRR